MILRAKTRGGGGGGGGGGIAARSFRLVYRTLGKRNQMCEEERKNNWRERKAERKEKGWDERKKRNERSREEITK